MGNVNVMGSEMGSSLGELLLARDLQPGDSPSYQLCKTIYSYHPLGAKVVEAPIKLAMSKRREIRIPDSPEDMVRDAFNAEWNRLGADAHIFNVKKLSRVYGIASIAYGAEGVPTDQHIEPKDLYRMNLYFNVFDPLNTAGSLVLNQNPNSPDFQKHTAIAVNGQVYHRSRSCVVLNEAPVYIDYTTSAFGFVGRSVYQRALFPLKSFVQSMITDDVVQRKAGVLVAKMKPSGSITDKIASAVQGAKRALLQEAQTGNVISIHPDEDISAIDLENTHLAMTASRSNIIENIASSASIPPKILMADSYAGVLANGTEDYRQTMLFIEEFRGELRPLYDFFDEIVMHRAWNPDFYRVIQNLYPEYEGITYEKAFYDWKNSFRATWPSLMIEPDSERIKVDEIRLRAIISAIEVMAPTLDQENKTKLLQWAADNLNSLPEMFDNPLIMDWEQLAAHIPMNTGNPDELNPHMHI